MVRQYSLCGTASATPVRYHIGVALVQESKGGSARLHKWARDGLALGIGRPRNNFVLESAPSYSFVAGGIGITPILSMIAQCNEAGVAWRLLYLCRTPDRMAFSEELIKLDAGRERAVLVSTDQQGIPDIQSWAADGDAGEMLYCCGPSSLIEAVGSIARLTHPGLFRAERFQRRQDESEANEAFEVQLVRSRKNLKVHSNQSILDAVCSAGIEVPNSCREGLCGSCETAVIEGIPDHRDSVLSDNERRNGTRMMCVSRAKTPVLLLDL
nr:MULTISPECIES: PDR/VanB family oxidoreductase [unclassified Paraburkholderia]